MAATSLIAVLFIAGLWIVFRLALWWTGDRSLASLVGLAYIVRALLAIALYGISLWSLPVLQSLHLGQGFWTFAPDSAYFHDYAKGAAVALAAGLELPFVSGSPEYPLVVTIAYRVLGPQPLFLIWLNIALACLTVLLAYSLARTIWGNVQASRTVAALIAFWPSSVLWATQLLKDSLETFLIVAFLWAFHRIMSGSEVFGTRPPRVMRVVTLAGVFISLFAAVRFRVYVGLALFVSALAALVACAATDLWNRRYGRAGAICATAAWLACSLWTTTWIGVEGLGKSDNPEIGHTRLAEYMVSIGDMEGALWQLRAAAVVNQKLFHDRAKEEGLAQAELQRLLAAHRERSGKLAHPEPSSAVANESLSLRPDWYEGPSELLNLLSLSSLAELRRGFFIYSGPMLGRPDDVARDLGGLVRYAPQALANALFSPHPWTPHQGGRATGMFRTAAMGEVLLVVALLYFSARGLASALRRAWPLGVVIGLYSLFLIAGLGYFVPNAGAIFRLRLVVIVPLCILAGGSDLPDYLARARAWARTRVIAGPTAAEA